MDPNFIPTVKEQMRKALEVLLADISTIRTGRAAPALVENIVVSAYQGSTRLKVMELAMVSASDPQTLVITPFDASVLEEIRKGIMEAQAGLNPSTDGQVIRVSIPPLSEERRQELIHAMKQKLENGRIMVRQVRHEAMENIRKNSKDLGEDEVRRLEKDVQASTDDFISQIDTLGKKKEEELLAI